MKDILLDSDDVLGDFTSKVFGYIKEKFCIEYKFSDFSNWDYIEQFPPNIKKSVKEYMDSQNFVLEIEPRQDAKDFLKAISGKLDPYVLTSPRSGPYWKYEREIWLKQKFRFKKNHIIQTSAKQKVHGDIFVDDSPENIVKWHDYWTKLNMKPFAVLLVADHTEKETNFESVKEAKDYVNPLKTRSLMELYNSKLFQEFIK